MVASLGGFLAVCIVIGLLFTAFGLIGYSELPARSVIAVTGILFIIGGATGAVKLKKLRYG